MRIERELKKYYALKTGEARLPVRFEALRDRCRPFPRSGNGFRLSLCFYSSLCAALVLLVVAGALHTSPIHERFAVLNSTFGVDAKVFGGLNQARVLIQDDLKR